MIGVFEMVVLIVAIIAVSTTIEAYLKAQRGAPKDDARLAELTAEVQALRTRVQTLERLATDPDRQLRAEFDKLAA
jgi:cell division protein FtsB